MFQQQPRTEGFRGLAGRRGGPRLEISNLDFGVSTEDIKVAIVSCNVQFFFSLSLLYTPTLFCFLHCEVSFFKGVTVVWGRG